MFSIPTRCLLLKFKKYGHPMMTSFLKVPTKCFPQHFFRFPLYFKSYCLRWAWVEERTIAGLTFEIEEWAALCQLIGMPATLRHGQHKFANKFILLKTNKLVFFKVSRVVPFAPCRPSTKSPFKIENRCFCAKSFFKSECKNITGYAIIVCKAPGPLP